MSFFVTDLIKSIRSIMFAAVSYIIVIALLGNPSKAYVYIKTTPTQTTKTTYVGKAYTTGFDSQNVTTASFLGIPFAVPPARFDKPILDTPKEDVFTATTFASACPQDNAINNYCSRKLSEDCLYLNIYVPLPSMASDDLGTSNKDQDFNNSSSSKNESNQAQGLQQATDNRTRVLPINTKYAVFIYIHGGALFIGDGSCYDGSVLSGIGNIIVVTINYRLGNLGFLTTNDGVIPGNLGLWDQHVAIQWVNNNIHVFGGDSGRITLGGQSAGSYSAIFQALYAGNDNLFQRVIAQSGTPVAAKSVSTVGYQSTLAVAESLSCCTDCTTLEIKSCLMNKTSDEIIRVQSPMLIPGSLPIEPTLDPPFVTEDPYYLMSKMTTSLTTNSVAIPSSFIKRDLLIGVNYNDGDVVIAVLAYILLEGNLESLPIVFQAINPSELLATIIKLYLQRDLTDIVDGILIDAVLDRYIDWDESSNDTFLTSRIIEFLTDVYFTLPSQDTASAHIPIKSSYLNQPGQENQASGIGTNINENITQGHTFLYRFRLPKDTQTLIPWFQGTGHGSETSYFFKTSMFTDTADIKLARYLMKYWSNFVKSGNPNIGDQPTTSSSELPSWPEYNNQDQQYLELSTNPVAAKRMRAAYRHFWTDFIPKLKARLAKMNNNPQNCTNTNINNVNTVLRGNVFILTALITLTSVLSVT